MPIVLALEQRHERKTTEFLISEIRLAIDVGVSSGICSRQDVCQSCASLDHLVFGCHPRN
jgi:hypothetical protein